MIFKSPEVVKIPRTGESLPEPLVVYQETPVARAGGIGDLIRS
jgi:hypothetical protein